MRVRHLSLSVFELLECRQMLSATVRPIDEVGNNVANPTWGTAGTDLIRLAAAAYADGVSSPSLADDLECAGDQQYPQQSGRSSDPSLDVADGGSEQPVGFWLCIRAVHGS